MFIVNNYPLAIIFCVITMLCWGSWGNTQKLAGKTWRYELFYWDYVIGVLLLSLIFAFTLGSNGSSGRSFLVDWAQADWTPKSMADLPLGIVPAEYLVADTGTAMVVCHEAHERLMCYLPPVCIVVGRASQLFEHMPAAWPSIASAATGPDLRGEFVFITGSSRTSDIEKILILGVHGPKRLVVFIID